MFSIWVSGSILYSHPPFTRASSISSLDQQTYFLLTPLFSNTHPILSAGQKIRFISHTPCTLLALHSFIWRNGPNVHAPPYLSIHTPKSSIPLSQIPKPNLKKLLSNPFLDFFSNLKMLTVLTEDTILPSYIYVHSQNGGTHHSLSFHYTRKKPFTHSLMHNRKTIHNQKQGVPVVEAEKNRAEKGDMRLRSKNTEFLCN